MTTTITRRPSRGATTTTTTTTTTTESDNNRSRNSFDFVLQSVESSAAKAQGRMVSASNGPTTTTNTFYHNTTDGSNHTTSSSAITGYRSSSNGGSEANSRSYIMQNKRHARQKKRVSNETADSETKKTPSTQYRYETVESPTDTMMTSEGMEATTTSVVIVTPPTSASREEVMVVENGLISSGHGIAHHEVMMDGAAHQAPAPSAVKRLDKYGFILNMDSNGHVYEDACENERLESNSEHQTRARREKKWGTMMQSWNTTRSRRTKLLSKRLRKGIPDAMRGKVWCLLGGVEERMRAMPGLYQQLVQTSWDATKNSTAPTVATESYRLNKNHSLSSSVSFRATQDTIERDLHRTFPRHNMFHESDAESDEDGDVAGCHNALMSLGEDAFSSILTELEHHDGIVGSPSSYNFRNASGGQAALRRVLRAYSVYDRELGYCQGMNFITGMFLTFTSEEEAFWLLVATMNNSPCRMRGLFGEGMHETHMVLYVAEQLTNQFLPKLAKHFEKEHIHVTMYATQWLLTVFTSSFNFDLVVRVWDCFLSEGWKIVYRVNLALLQQSQGQLMKMTFEDILAHFRTLPEHVDGSEIMAAALKIPLRRKQLVKYEKEWLKQQESRESAKYKEEVAQAKQQQQQQQQQPLAKTTQRQSSNSSYSA